MHQQPRIDVPASGAHYQSFERSKAHARVDARPVTDSADARSVAEVTDDKSRSLSGTAQAQKRAIDYISV